MKVLLAGWFSFEQMGATAGDLLCRDLVRRWLREAGIDHDVAVAHPFTDGIGWRTVDPGRYTHLIFVCGPFGNGPPVDEMLAAFAHCRMIGLNLSMLQDLNEWDPFELLIERDSSRTARPDMVFLTEQPKVPVIGVVLVHPQGEYGSGRAMHRQANEAIERVLSQREAALVRIDTRLDENSCGLRTPAEVESLIARVDAVITTRLHGLVMSIKNGVPVVAVDPIRGGAKIVRQAQTIGWKYVTAADHVEEAVLLDWLDYCLTAQAREEAARCAAHAKEQLKDIHRTFLTSLDRPEA
jgi:hypothetical protein